MKEEMIKQETRAHVLKLEKQKKEHEVVSISFGLYLLEYRLHLHL